jgi:hypothetical protein
MIEALSMFMLASIMLAGTFAIILGVARRQGR